MLQQLGAQLHDVRLRPLRDYYDVWTLIEEPETFAIQRQALTERPHDFGTVFLERTLIACLIQGADYVRAQQERSRMLSEMHAALADCETIRSRPWLHIRGHQHRAVHYAIPRA